MIFLSHTIEKSCRSVLKCRKQIRRFTDTGSNKEYFSGRSDMISKTEQIKLNQAIERFRTTYPDAKTFVTPRQLEVFYAQLHRVPVEAIETERFVQWLEQAEQLGFLQGVRKYKQCVTRGGLAYYNRYKWKLFELASDFDMEACFNRFHPRMKSGLSYYLKHPLEFDEDMTYLEQLSHRLTQAELDLTLACTINQRSFQLFQNEKLLPGKGLKATDEDLRWQRVIKRLNLTGAVDSLNYVELKQLPQTIEINRKDEAGVVLILENQDPLLTVLEVLQRDYPMNESPIDALVFGSGKSCESLFYYLNEGIFKGVLGHPQTIYYYAGDLDTEGLKIFHRLTQRYPARTLRYLPHYFQCLVQTLGTMDWRQTTQQKPQTEDLDWMMTLFHAQNLSDEIIDGIFNQLNQRKMIPQEVMTAETWRTYLKQLTLS